jgi:hypothetical protein
MIGGRFTLSAASVHFSSALPTSHPLTHTKEEIIIRREEAIERVVVIVVVVFFLRLSSADCCSQVNVDPRDGASKAQ